MVHRYSSAPTTVGFGQRQRPLHNRYTRTDTFSVGEWPLHIAVVNFLIVSLPGRFRNGRFTSETATWIQKCFQKSVGNSIFYGALDIIVFQGGDDGRGYRNIYKIPRGSNSN
jgi:hypothetical protein